MKIISWNVAGFRACLNKGFDMYFRELDADIVCLQEVKATESEILFQPLGYTMYLNPAEKKGYAGTLVFTRKRPILVNYGMGIAEHDQEGRMITLEYNDFYLINVYVPNSKRELLRLEYRMKWEDDFLNYVNSLQKQKPVIICGDMNVAHTEMDIKNAKENHRNPGFTDEEREKFENLLSNGFVDTYRYFNPNVSDAYTWWTYLQHCREKNIGWRIDYFLVTSNYMNQVKDAQIYQEILGSDHCPIGIELN